MADSEELFEGGRLPDEAVVVRGGMMASEFLFKAARKHFVEEGVWAISVASVPGLNAEDIAKESPFIKGSQIRSTYARTLRERGYEVAPDGPPHALIYLPRPAEGEDDPMWDDLRSIFLDIQPNPNHGGGQSS